MSYEPSPRSYPLPYEPLPASRSSSRSRSSRREGPSLRTEFELARNVVHIAGAVMKERKSEHKSQRIDAKHDRQTGGQYASEEGDGRCKSGRDEGERMVRAALKGAGGLQGVSRMVGQLELAKSSRAGSRAGEASGESSRSRTPSDSALKVKNELKGILKKVDSPEGMALLAGGVAALGLGAAEVAHLATKRQRQRSAAPPSNTDPRTSTPTSFSSNQPCSTLSSTPRERSYSTPTTTIILSSPPLSSLLPSPKRYISELTSKEHKHLRHAAAALLLREKVVLESLRGAGREVASGALHEVGSAFERIVGFLTRREPKQQHRPGALFGVPLKHLIKVEGSESSLGMAESSTLRIPTFVDHCISALMQMDLTEPGLLRVSGDVRLISQIIQALEHAGHPGETTTIDLSTIHPAELLAILKHFFRVLPHPIVTGEVFELMVVCAKIGELKWRRRMLHLCLCLLPKVNRDVLETLLLFLDWFSQQAHVDVRVGNQMDLSSVAIVMAPTLLGPENKQPYPKSISAMVAGLLTLLEDQHILNEIPFELAKVLHLTPSPTTSASSRQDATRALVQHWQSILPHA